MNSLESTGVLSGVGLAAGFLGSLTGLSGGVVVVTLAGGDWHLAQVGGASPELLVSAREEEARLAGKDLRSVPGS